MLMVLFPARVTVNWFMRWLGVTDRPGRTDAQSVLELTYLGLKHFRMPPETLRVVPTVFSDDQLRAIRVPTLLLIGEHEVVCDPAAALARARELFPDIRELVSGCRHDMCFSQHRIVARSSTLKKPACYARGCDFLTGMVEPHAGQLL
jgi:pimeloyl-ACP methyl ester carboxylesterase